MGPVEKLQSGPQSQDAMAATSAGSGKRFRASPTLIRSAHRINRHHDDRPDHFGKKSSVQNAEGGMSVFKSW
jgi:hypothetical protein